MGKIKELPSIKNVIYIVIALIILALVTCCTLMSDYEVNQQNVYFFYSAAAQTIATFSAFLIAGYAFVHQAMDNLESKDDTLFEVHHKIKVDYYNNITRLSVIIGIAVGTSLLSVWLNGFGTCVGKYVFTVSSIFIIFAIILGLSFIVYIIDPNKIRNTALKLIDIEFRPIGELEDKSTFINNFIELEKVTRNILEKKFDFPVKRYAGFRFMLDTIYRLGYLSEELYDELLQLSKYRNLVIHGHLEEVDKNMVVKVREALMRMKSILPKRIIED